jgi:cell wall-associated NlpC family hydrolase
LVSFHRTNLNRRILPAVALAATTAAAVLAAPGPFASAAPSAPAAQARITAVRLSALRWAERQVGKWYCYGGDGPSCFDCSGLVLKAYEHAGVWLPRTTYGMLDSRKLREIPARDRKPGDLAFYGPGHVELVTARGTFGALEGGTQLGWHHPSPWWYPTMYFEIR